MFISEEIYGRIRDSMPILCVDVLPTFRDKFVLIKRKEEPMRGTPWVTGGRVHKGETLRAAAKRKLIEELAPWGYFRDDSLRMIGVYQDIYPAHSGGPAKAGYHTVAVAFTVEMLDVSGIKLDDTSSGWGLYDYPPDRFRVEQPGSEGDGWLSYFRRTV